MSAPELAAGDVLLERYQLVRPIITQELNEVWEATQLNLGRRVALKIYPASPDPRRLSRRFEREAAALAKLHHPHVVTIHDFGELSEGRPFLAMEYLVGRPLSWVIDEEPPLALRRITQLGLQMARGLRAVHEAGIVHRNLKPGNVLLTSRPEDDGNLDVIKLLGFGLAKVSDSVGDDITATAMGFAGAPEFLSPEQVSQGDPDARSDIYALGIILYALVAGSVPYSGGTKVQVARGHLLDPLPPFSSKRFGRSCPDGLGDVIRGCLEKEADRRPASGDALVSTLERVIEQELRASRPPPARGGPTGRVSTLAVGAAPSPPNPLLEPDPTRAAGGSVPSEVGERLLEPDPTVYDRPRGGPDGEAQREPPDTLVSQPVFRPRRRLLVPLLIGFAALAVAAIWVWWSSA